MSYSDLKFDFKSIKAKIISHQPQTVKVHVLGLNHHPENFEVFQANIEGFKVNDEIETFKFASFENVYLSEKNLSDEINYVLERKSKSTFMGNTLEKPSGLLKRHFNKKTTAENEHLEVERDYTQLDGTADRKANVSNVQRQNIRGSGANYTVIQLNSFLKNNGSNLLNQKIEDNGELNITEEQFQKLKGFNTLMLVIEDSKSSIVQVLKNTSSDIQSKPITLGDSKTANKVYLYERAVANLKTGDKHSFKDLNSTEMSMIEDRKNLIDMLKLVSGTDNFSEWSFLEKWDQMTPEEQLTKYDKYACHEFNLFAYFRCPDFFEMVIKDHIVNKVEK